MPKRIKSLLERFPKFTGGAKSLIQTHPEFEALCDEYNNVNEALLELNRGDDTSLQESERLSHRRRALEEEMLAIMEANIRV